MQAVVSYARESDRFEMVDAILANNCSAAARTLHRLLDEGMAAPYLLFVLTKQFRLMIQARSLASDRLP